MNKVAKTTERVYPYHVFLLDHELLRHVETLLLAAGEREKGELVLGNQSLGTVEEAKRIVDVYRSLMSNGPRNDPTIRKIYGVQAIGLEEAIDEELKQDEAPLISLTSRKATAALELFEKGFYTEFARIDAECADDVMAIANGQVVPYWRDVKSKDYEVISINARNAGNYDLIVRFGRPFLKMSLGYIDLQEGVYASELV